jgi:hypothetical protein
MFVVMFAFSVASAGGYYLIRADGKDVGMTVAALIFMLASPVLVMAALSLSIVFMRWLQRRKR